MVWHWCISLSIIGITLSPYVISLQSTFYEEKSDASRIQFAVKVPRSSGPGLIVSRAYWFPVWRGRASLGCHLDKFLVCPGWGLWLPSGDHCQLERDWRVWVELRLCSWGPDVLQRYD